MRIDEIVFAALRIALVTGGIVLLVIGIAGCSSVTVGGGYVQDGWNAEVTALSPKNLGIRGSFGQENLPSAWSEWGTTAERYAVGVLWQPTIYKGFYAEPRLDLAYYPTLGTEFELEAAIRIGYQYDGFGVYIGVRHPLGNGDRHEDIGRYSHTPDGWKAEAGATYTWRW